MLFETYNQPWDYELLDTGNSFRLEKWGEVILMRPDPQAIWQPTLPQKEWSRAWAVYRAGSNESGGKWEIKKTMPSPWNIKFSGVQMSLKLSPFKHTGVFAEQAAQWDWMTKQLSSYQVITLKDKPKILNLFAYTGAASMVFAKAGCYVTHVDASKPAITWANENAELNKLSQNSIRWILDDAVKFVQREIKRGQKYDGIILDPPAFGHGPSGKTWKFSRDVPRLLSDCVKLLSLKTAFLLINGYATNSSAISLNNILEDTMAGKGGKIEFGELCLKQKSGRMISTGIFARWSK